MSLLHDFRRWAILWIRVAFPSYPTWAVTTSMIFTSFYQDTAYKTLIPRWELPIVVCGLSKVTGNSWFSRCTTKSHRKLEWTLPSSPCLYFLGISQMSSPQALAALQRSGTLLLSNLQAGTVSPNSTFKITSKSQGGVFCLPLLPLPPLNRGGRQCQSLISP